MNYIHLVVRESQTGVVQILGAYAQQDTARHHLALYESVSVNEQSCYPISFQVDVSDNEEGLGFGTDLPDYNGGETIFLVVETENKKTPGTLAIAAFTDKEEADSLVVRRHAFNGQVLSVVSLPVDFSSPPKFYEIDT